MEQNERVACHHHAAIEALEAMDLFHSYTEEALAPLQWGYRLSDLVEREDQAEGCMENLHRVALTTEVEAADAVRAFAVPAAASAEVSAHYETEDETCRLHCFVEGEKEGDHLVASVEDFACHWGREHAVLAVVR